MAISIKHFFTSAKSDGTDATLVQPSNWNEEHVLTQAPNTILGRATAGTGATEEISLSGPFTMAGGTFDFVDGAITPAKLSSTMLQLIGALTDPGADSIVYWDNTANDFVWLTLGTGLAISGGELNVDVGGLADGAVTEPKLATSAVTEAKIAPGSVTVDKLAAPTGSDSEVVTGTAGADGEYAQWSGGDLVGVAPPVGGPSGSINTVTRAASTSYQNTQGKPILFMIEASVTGGNALFIELSEDNSTWETAYRGAPSGSPTTLGASVVVPDNFHYRWGGGTSPTAREIY
jgi:hypothetical protein